MSNTKLYEDIPPTQLRHKDEKFRKAESVPIFEWLADTMFNKMLRGNFYALRYKNEENYKKINPDFPCIAFAAHGNWWDGLTGYTIIRQVFHKHVRMMVEELNRFPLLSKAGAFPVNKKNAQTAMKALKYSVDAIGEKNVVMWIFPQGIIKPPHFRPIEFQTGLSYIAQKSIQKYGGINILPVATNFTFLREDIPEILVDIAEPIIMTEFTMDRKEHSQMLAQHLEQLLDKQFDDIRHGNLEGYKTLFQKKLPWFKKLEKKLKTIEKEFIDK